jgi:uncharacterized protein (TIGR02246 family)
MSGVRVIVATVVLLAAVTSIVLGSGSFTVPVSNVSAATVISEDGKRLDLLVVWRGSPGWMRGGHRSRSAGGSGRTHASSETFGDVQLDVEFDFATRIARVAEHHVSMGSDNVVLVDRVDERGRSVIVRTISIDGTLPGSSPDISPVVARSPEIVSYIQCDAKVPNPGPLDAVADWCAPLIAAGANVVVSPESQIRARLQQYVQLVRKMDHAGIAAMFAADGEVVNPGRDPIRGRAAIQAFLEQFAGYQVINDVMVPLTTTVDGNHATETGTYRQRVRGPDGNIIEVSGNFALDWIRDSSGVWLIQRAATTPQS